MSRAYYNEFDSFAASWLRNLISKNLIAPGDVDERSIKEVKAEDLKGYTQCHFFAGIGIWSYALRRAGWPDDRPVWTGSCPCQSFSIAGKRKGFADERHLWPVWFPLIRECRPVAIFGEQVASKDALAWLDLVSSDLENADYACGAVDTCAAGYGAPHIRQRLYWVADACVERRQQIGQGASRNEAANGRARWNGRESDGDHVVGSNGEISELADAESQRHGSGNAGTGRRRESSNGGVLGDSDATRSQGRSVPRTTGERDDSGERAVGSPSASFWSACAWLPCIDGKARPVEPGTFPLAHGIANRVGLLRGYGNSLVAPQAQAFVEAYLEVA